MDKKNKRWIVIATGNTKDFPGRYRLPLFEHAAETIYIDFPEPKYLAKKTLSQMLKPFPVLNKEDLRIKLVKALNLARKYQPYFSYSFRDLEDLSVRFMTLFERERDINRALFLACYGQFVGTIQHRLHRIVFLKQLSAWLKMDLDEKDFFSHDVIPISNHFFLPASMSYIVEVVQQKLLMRQFLLNHPEFNLMMKKGVILEGPSGQGKSSLFQLLLKKYGFSEEKAGTEKSHEVSGGTVECVAAMLQSAENGSAIVVNEFNVGNLEALTNQIFSGVTPVGKVVHKGFIGFCSQNSSAESKREPLSLAVMNRQNVVYMNHLNQRELTAIASRWCKYPSAFVHAFFRVPKADLRKFYTAVEIVKAEEAREEKVPDAPALHSG